MQVVSLAPVPVASLRWRVGEDPWILSIITKLTFRLEPGVAKVHKMHDPVHEEDQHEDGFLVAPSDLVPSRPLVDVTVVGNAYAPHGGGRSIAPRLSMPGIDKQLIIDAKESEAAVPLYRANSRQAGFGPLPPRAPERSKLLHGLRAPTPLPNRSVVLPSDFDLTFFNAAPADQRLTELSPEVRLHLEQLHPEHSVLETRLPDMAPQVFVERVPGAGREEHSAAISSLWIDTRRSLLTVTWHSQVPLEAFDEPGKIFVAIAGPARRLNIIALGKLIGSLGGAKRVDRAPADEDPTVDEDAGARHRASLTPEEGTLTTVLDRVLEPTERTAERTADPAPMPKAEPAWVGKGGSPNSSPAPPLSMRDPLPTVPGLGPPSFVRPPTPQRPGELADTSSLPKLESPAFEPVRPRAAPVKTDSSVVQLLWFDPAATERLRRRWPHLCHTLDFSPADPAHDLPGRDYARARDHHLHFGVLTEAPTVTVRELRDELLRATSDSGRFTPPLVALSGELSFPFEELAILRATAAAIRPVVGEDKKLLETLGQVKELADTPLLGGSSETVANFTRHLRKLYGDSRRSLSLEYLDDAVKRSLLEERRYQKRSLFGDTWIRALFVPSGSGESMVAYLPARLDQELPMMVSFEARVIAELHVRQDQYEPHPYALRVVSLGRIIRFAGD
ncbi:MAG TPA: DUF2169 domain-containing protein [Polyangiaceae bacterium]|jgi:hypothetical protein|nr:DUF2169 domain-containing protein [Polyangiaceae bacterium]